MRTTKKFPEITVETFEKFRFDPSSGTTIAEPEGIGYGYWAGGHKVYFDEESNRFVLFHRLRTPLELGRGGWCGISVSDDGIRFEKVWEATKEQFAASSIEVGQVIRTPTGNWRLYISYELAGARMWRVDVLEAERIEDLATQSRRTVLQPSDYGVGSIKDPVVYLVDEEYHVYVVGGGARRPPESNQQVLYAWGTETTFLARSTDGLYFPSLEVVFKPTQKDTWDGRRARINSIIEADGAFLAFYDGGRTFYDTYEEWCGIAWSEDGTDFNRIELNEPWIRSPYGSVRYVCVILRPEGVFFYYEYTRDDGSHDLRVAFKEST